MDTSLSMTGEKTTGKLVVSVMNTVSSFDRGGAPTGSIWPDQLVHIDHQSYQAILQTSWTEVWSN